ncbi:MAG: TonB-dependent receptor [bacterium]
MSKFLAGLFFCVVLFAHYLYSQDIAEDSIHIYYLDEIVVTATRYKMMLRDISATVSVVTESDLAGMNLHRSTDILGYLPGIFINKTGDFGRADVDIRGIGDRGRSVMVLIDGRPVKMGLYGCTITHSLPMDNVERIEVVRGPASVLYGSDALGGVINIITKKPVSRFEGDFDISIASYNTQQYRLRTGSSIKPWHFYTTADYRLSNGHVDNSAYDGKNWTGRLGLDINNFITAVLSANYFSGRKEEPLRSTDPDTISSDIWNDYERAAFDLTITGHWSKQQIMTKAYRNQGEHEFSDGWHSKDYNNGFLSQGTIDLGIGNKLTVGADLRQQGGERIGIDSIPWEKTEYGVFFHDEQILFDKTVFSLGARLNHDGVSGNTISPQIGFVMQPFDATIVRASINKGFRSPQINELYLFPASNTNLKAEVVWNYEAGVNQRIIRGLNIEVTSFIMKGSNMIQTVINDNPPPLYIFDNSGAFEFHGVEVGMIGNYRNIVHARINHSFLDPAEHTTGRPKHKTDTYLRLVHTLIDLGFSAQYVTEYFAADSSQDPIDDYLIVGSKITWKLPFGLQPFVAVDNILDYKYDIYVNLPGSSAGLYQMPRRIYTAGFSYKF